MTVPTLTDNERNSWMTALTQWSLTRGDDAIEREFTFADFSEAFAFMTRVAMLADKRDHHPEWSNVYDKVTIALTTHDAGEDGGLSLRDMHMASAIDAIVAD